jgi:hypothetical protein
MLDRITGSAVHFGQKGLIDILAILIISLLAFFFIISSGVVNLGDINDLARGNPIISPRTPTVTTNSTPTPSRIPTSSSPTTTPINPTNAPTATPSIRPTATTIPLVPTATPSQNPTTTPSQPPTGGLAFLSDFETGAFQCPNCNPDGWVFATSQPDAALIAPASEQAPRKGNYSARIHMDQNDSFGGESPRAEIATFKHAFFDVKKEYWVGWSIYIPTDYVFDFKQNEILTQFRHRGQLCGSLGGSPPNALEPRNGQWQWSARSTSDPCPSQSPRETLINMGPMEKGKWTDFVARFYFSSGNDGILQVWRDGTLYVDRVNQPNYYAMSQGPTMKIGIYKWDWDNAPSDSSSLTAYFDEVRVFEGTNGKSAVSP